MNIYVSNLPDSAMDTVGSLTTQLLTYNSFVLVCISIELMSRGW